MTTRPVELSDSDADLDRFFEAHSPRLIVAQIDTSLEVEEKGMDLKQRSGLKGLMANRNKRQTSRDVPKVQVPPSLPPPPPLPTDLGLQANSNMRRKRTVDDLEEGEVGPQKGVKQQKKAREPKDKRVKFMDNRDEAIVRQGQRTWSPRLKIDGAPISWDARIWESQRGQARYLAEAL